MESKIGLALRVNPSSDTENLGEYIAVCANQKCGYLGGSAYLYFNSLG
jgi:hypothetical protein